MIQTARLKYELCAVWEANLINWKAVLLMFAPAVLPFNQAERQTPAVLRGTTQSWEREVMSLQAAFYNHK